MTEKGNAPTAGKAWPKKEKAAQMLKQAAARRDGQTLSEYFAATTPAARPAIGVSVNRFGTG